MTTAARPTFDPAKGGSGVREKSLGKLSQQVSARDLPAHLTLKERLVGQDTADEVKERDLKAELEDRERIAAIEKAKGEQFKYLPSLEQTTQVRLALKLERDKEREAEKDALLDTDSIDLNSVKGLHLVNARKMAQLDADEDFGSINSDSDFDDDGDNDDDDNELDDEDENDDDEDDPAELMAELEKIKQERAVEEKRREQEREKKKEEQLSKSSSESSFAIKRRWDDDVPFKNCARGEPDSKKKLFVNDTLRQEFHKKFMDKYIL